MIADGDNRIQFANKNEIGKSFRDLARDTKQSLDAMVAKYNIYAAKPLQVGGIEAGSAEEDLPAVVENSQGLLGGVLDGGLDN
jgi:hypothetical protein